MVSFSLLVFRFVDRRRPIRCKFRATRAYRCYINELQRAQQPLNEDLSSNPTPTIAAPTEAHTELRNACAGQRRSLVDGLAAWKQDVGIAELPEIAHPHRVEHAVEVIAFVLHDT